MSANTNALSSAPFLGSRDVHLKQCKPATTFWVGLRATKSVCLLYNLSCQPSQVLVKLVPTRPCMAMLFSGEFLNKTNWESQHASPVTDRFGHHQALIRFNQIGLTSMSAAQEVTHTESHTNSPDLRHGTQEWQDWLSSQPMGIKILKLGCFVEFSVRSNQSPNMPQKLALRPVLTICLASTLFQNTLYFIYYRWALLTVLVILPGFLSWDLSTSADQ